MAELRYNLENIRALLMRGFNDKELRRLVFDVPGLRTVYDELAENTGKADIVDKLLDYADRQMQMQALLSLAKKRNPVRYEKEEPYYIGDPTEVLQEQVADLIVRLSEITSRSSRLSREDQYRTACHWAEFETKVSLRRFDLNEANLHKAILEEADLRQTNLQKANLRQAQLSGAIFFSFPRSAWECISLQEIQWAEVATNLRM